MLSLFDVSLAKDTPYTWIVFCGDKVLVDANTLSLPKKSVLTFGELNAYFNDVYQLSDMAGEPLPFFVVDIGLEQLSLQGLEFVSLRQVMMNTPQGAFDVVGRAWQLVHFFRTHRYCGKCGSKMSRVNWETAVQCTRCDHRCYPRVSPCVIIAIYRDDQILLAKSTRHIKTGMYSTIAGFVESGESLEEAVEREIFEEVGVRVTDIEYFGSQPWPFPHALMMGYLARWESGEINIDDHEIADAQWFSVNDLPFVPPKFSIAGQLIEAVINRQ